MARVQQITQVVGERRRNRQLIDFELVEWQTRVLCTYIAHTTQDPQTAKSLLRQIDKIEITVEEQEEPRQMDARPKDMEERLQPGTYERLMAGFGGGR